MTVTATTPRRRRSQPPTGRPRRPVLDLPPNRLLVRRATAFVATGGLVAYLALDGGGYDIVVRQQVGLVIWALVALGFALGVLPRSRPTPILVVPLAAAAGLLLWMLLSFAWTESAERSTAEVARLLNYLGIITLAVASLNRHTFRAAAAGGSVAAIGVTGLALASRLDPGAFPNALEVARLFRTDRLDYPLDYWNAVGAWAAMSVAIALAWSAHARLAAVRALSLAVVPACGLVVYLTYSRGGVVGSGAAVLAVLVLSRNRWTAFAHALTAGGGAAVAILVAREHEEIAEATGGSGAGAVVSTLIVAGLACAVVALFTRSLAVDRLRLPPHTARRFVPGVVALVLVSLLLVGRGPIGEAWHDFRHDEEVSAGPDPASRLTTAGGNRNDLWSSALDAFDAHPLNGIGPGTYEFFWLQDARDPEYVRDAHSLYLEQMAELGLPGLLLVLGLLGGLLAAALKARGSLESPGDLAASVALTSAFVVFTVNAGVDWMWEETAVGALALGGIAIAAAGGAGRQRRRRRRGPIWRPGVRTGIVALAIVAAAFEVPGLVATQRVRSSEDAARDGDLEGAGELVKDAIDAQPWAATPHVQLALVLEQQGDLDAARSEIREAISKERASWEWPLIEARIESELGNRQGARRTFTKGRRLWPLSPFYSPFSELGQDVYTRRQLLRLAGQPIGK